MKKITNKIIMIASIMGVVTLIVGIIGIVSFAKTKEVRDDIKVAGIGNLWIKENNISDIISSFTSNKTATDRFLSTSISSIIGGQLKRREF